MKISIQTKLAVLISLFGLLQSGCGGSNTAATNGNQPSSLPGGTLTTTSLNWSSVWEQVVCEAMANNYCSGYYGFTVNNTGKYIVRPDPYGHAVTGTLSQSDFSMISADANAAAISFIGALSITQVCQNTGGIIGSTDNVEVTSTNQITVEVYSTSNGSTCYEGDQNAASKLHSDLRSLLTKYYPVPFPAQ